MSSLALKKESVYLGMTSMLRKDGIMVDTESRTSLNSNIPQDFPGTVETFADVLKLLGIESLDVDAEIQDLAVRGAPELLERYGPMWFKEHRVRLIQELELLNEM